MVHVVPPFYRKSSESAWEGQLEKAWISALNLGVETSLCGDGAVLVAPLLSAGARCAPTTEAARVAVTTALKWQSARPRALGKSEGFELQLGLLEDRLADIVAREAVAVGWVPV